MTNIKQYSYHVEDFQFSFDFEAPLLGMEGDKIKIFDYLKKDDGSYDIFEFNEVTILQINFEDEYIECRGCVGE